MIRPVLAPAAEALEIISAQLVDPRKHGRASSPAAAQGLRFERAVAKSLLALSLEEHFTVEHNPFIQYWTVHALHAYCEPDFVLTLQDGTVVVVECKLTWVPDALEKLQRLYLPVVAKIYPAKGPIRPLVIVKTTHRAAPPAAYSVREALRSPEPLVQWLGHGLLPW